MKTFKSCIVIITMLCAVLFISSCGDTIEGSVSFSGKVNVSPSTAKIGDEVIFSIENSYSIGGITSSFDSFTTIDGKEVVKSVVYYIDGNEVGQSSDKNNQYALKYKISGLAVGVHNVTARCESNFKDVEIVESISSGTLTIEE